MTGTGADPHPTTAPDPRSGTDAASQEPVSAVDDVCPYLRADGGEWRSAHPSRAHRCGAIEPPVPLATGKQRSLCLVQAHETCVTYLVARQRTHEAPGPVPTGADLWPETRSTPVLLDPPHAVLVPLAGGQARTGGQALLVGLMVLAFFVLVVARTSPPVEPGSASQGASAGIGALPSPSASASATASAVPSPTPLPTASPAPTPTVGPTPTSSPSPPPTPTASVRRYTVKSGDTLSGIAARFATTVKAIKVANGLRDNLIRTGQVLVIP